MGNYSSEDEEGEISDTRPSRCRKYRRSVSPRERERER